MHSFIHCGPPRSRTEGQPQLCVGRWEGPWEALLSLPLLCHPTLILHRAPLRLQVPYSHPHPCARVRLHPLPRTARRLVVLLSMRSLGPRPPFHRVCTRLHLVQSVHIQSPLLTTAPAPAPHPHAAASAHSPSCSGERHAGCLPRREAAGLQVLKILFEEEVLAGAPDRLPGCAPTCSTQGGLFLRGCQRLAGPALSCSAEEAWWLCSAFRWLLMSPRIFSEPPLTPENCQLMSTSLISFSWICGTRWYISAMAPYLCESSQVSFFF